jgi:hypothetical protein
MDLAQFSAASEHMQRSADVEGERVLLGGHRASLSNLSGESAQTAPAARCGAAASRLVS